MRAGSGIGRLHVITDELIQTRWTHVEIARMCAEAGADRVQFREKRPWTTRELVDVARSMTEVAGASGARVIVNDRVDVAVACGAAGVHLGRHDLEVRIARGILGAAGIVGTTANDLEEARRVGRAEVDYVGVGPVFGTRSKANPAPALGVEGLRRIVLETDRPVIAVGNITAERIPELFAAGVEGVAVLSAVVGAPDPGAATLRLREAIDAVAGVPAEKETTR